MKILFIDDEIENVKNLSKKIRSFELTKQIDFSLYLINENANLLVYKDSNELASIGFLKDDLYPYEILEYNELKKSLTENAHKYDVIIFDRQLQTNEAYKDGIDLLKASLEQLDKNCVFYLIISKETRKEGVLYDDIKRMDIDVRNYIDNSETTSSDLDRALAERIHYFSNHLFFRDVKKNNDQIFELLKENKFPLFTPMEILEIKSNLNFAFSLQNLEHNLLSEEKIYAVIINFYHLTLEKFLEYGKYDDKIIQDYNANIKVGKKLYSFLEKHKTIVKDEKGKLPRPTAHQKIIAYSVDDKFTYGDKFNTIRNDAIHLGYSSLLGVVFVNLTLALYVLRRKEDINYKLILYSLNNGFLQANDKIDLQKLILHIKSTV